RQEDGTPLADFKGNPTGHLSGLLYRNARLLENGIKPVYVFDGKPPDFKAAEIARRKEIKKEAEAKWREALDYGRLEEAKRFAQATSRLTSEMIEESKLLLSALGIQHLEAPSEGEAQAAHMAAIGLVYASASQDYDSLLFGAPKLLRNLSVSGKRKVPRQNRFVLVEPEEVLLEEALSASQLTREGLVLVGMLCGSDFNIGVKGVGPKTALKIVREHPSLSQVKAYVKSKYSYEFEEDVEAIFQFFIHPPVKEAQPVKLGTLQKEKILDLLVEKHDFSEERVGRVLESLEKQLAEKSSQKRIEDWF
ncbi:MAG: flap endonuclease-1, partial [Candidatus ainarchaeum sp.]|nr:flap endonuclease-1 [Candidatus ainarchaeum sp.]